MSHSNQSDIETEPFGEIAELLDVGIAIYDQSGQYIYVNQSYAELFDVTPSELKTKSLWEVVSRIDIDSFDEYWTSFDSVETREVEEVHRYNNQQVTVATTTTQHSIDNTQYHLKTISNISEWEAEEQQLTGQNQSPENFASVVCHDLRSPLSVAQGYIDLLQDDIDRDELQLVDDALERMSVLITELLRLTQNTDLNEMSAISLQKVTQQAWKNVETKQAVLCTPEADPQIIANESHLQQLFENLLRNAIKHDGSNVDVIVETTTDGFYIADDGSGISPDIRDRVFETGYTTEEDGTGFGLSIVQQIVTVHDWNIQITESADGGAQFNITGVEFDE
jgi:PAS domain S-box-containing protein